MDATQVLLTGGTGLVGGALLPLLQERGAQVTALTRRVERERHSPENGLTFVAWDGTTPPQRALEGKDAVVHLAGEPIFGGVPTARRKHRMRSSRVDSTRALVSQLEAAPASARPRTLVCASAVGFYGDRGDEWLDESSPPGAGFLAEVCRDWEREARRAEELGIAVVRLRFGIILSRQGGALSLLRRVFGANLGGRLGSGRQWVPWVHLDDAVGALQLALDGGLAGVANVVSPTPVTNRDLTRALAGQLHRAGFWAVPAFAMRAALGELADELLGSRRVRPAALEQAGYRFAFSELQRALARELS